MPPLTSWQKRYYLAPVNEHTVCTYSIEIIALPKILTQITYFIGLQPHYVNQFTFYFQIGDNSGYFQQLMHAHNFRVFLSSERGLTIKRGFYKMKNENIVAKLALREVS